MIYLIDDNRRSQQKEYGCDYLEQQTYAHVLDTIYRLTPTDDISRLKGASCILLHESFPDFNSAGEIIQGNTTVAEKIRTLAAAENIPIVNFSNGFIEIEHTSISPNFIAGINKRLMYRNLRDFLDRFDLDRKIGLKILVYGKNFIYRELELLYNRIANAINTKGKEAAAPEIIDQVEMFSELCGSKESVETAFSKLEGKPFLSYLEKIIKSIIRYGINIYNR